MSKVRGPRHIRVDVAALETARCAGEACGRSQESMVLGLLRLWAWASGEGLDTVSVCQLSGFFPGAGETLVSALIGFGFLRYDGGALRIAGASRWMAVSRARRVAGKASGRARKEVACVTRRVKGEAAAPTEVQTAPVAPPQLSLLAPGDGDTPLPLGCFPAKPPARLLSPFVRLVDALVLAYKEETGQEYGFHGAKDAKAVKLLLKLAKDDEAEVVRRWRRSLRQCGFNSARELYLLPAKWNTLAADDKRARSTQAQRIDSVDWDALKGKAEVPM